MKNQNFIWMFCGFIASFSGIEGISDSLKDCSGSIHLRADQICSLDEPFSQKKVSLGNVEGATAPEHAHSLYANVNAGVQVKGHTDALPDHKFESFDGYAFEKSDVKLQRYWMVIDEENLQKHGEEISEADPKNRIR
jgi:hypothetical protein